MESNSPGHILARSVMKEAIALTHLASNHPELATDILKSVAELLESVADFHEAALGANSVSFRSRKLTQEEWDVISERINRINLQRNPIDTSEDAP